MSYGTVAEFEAYLSTMGLPAPSDPALAAPFLAQATAYINAVYGPKFCGSPTGGFEQIDAFPRTGVVVYGQEVPPDVIPLAIKRASFRAAHLISTGKALVFSSTAGPRIKRQKVDGVAEREFFDDGLVQIGNSSAVIDTEIDGLLQPFLCVEDTGAGGPFMFTIGG